MWRQRRRSVRPRRSARPRRRRSARRRRRSTRPRRFSAPRSPPFASAPSEGGRGAREAAAGGGGADVGTLVVHRATDTARATNRSGGAARRSRAAVRSEVGGAARETHAAEEQRVDEAPADIAFTIFCAVAAAAGCELYSHSRAAADHFVNNGCGLATMAAAAAATGGRLALLRGRLTLLLKQRAAERAAEGDARRSGAPPSGRRSSSPPSDARRGERPRRRSPRASEGRCRGGARRPGAHRGDRRRRLRR